MASAQCHFGDALLSCPHLWLNTTMVLQIKMFMALSQPLFSQLLGNCRSTGWLPEGLRILTANCKAPSVHCCDLIWEEVSQTSSVFQGCYRSNWGAWEEAPCPSVLTVLPAFSMLNSKVGSLLTLIISPRGLTLCFLQFYHLLPVFFAHLWLPSPVVSPALLCLSFILGHPTLRLWCCLNLSPAFSLPHSTSFRCVSV